MKEDWLSFEQFRREYPEDRYEIIEIVRFDKGDVDLALQRITRISSKLVKLDIDADLITLSNFSKISQTRIVRSKTRRKATMTAKYVKTYHVPDFPIALVLAVDREKFKEEEIRNIREMIKGVLSDLRS